MATSRWRVWGMVAVMLGAVAVTGCAELDQLRAHNQKLDSELTVARGHIAALEAEKAQMEGTLGERDDEVRAARLEVELWQRKYETLDEARKRWGGAPGISPELEAQLRRLALLDPNIRVKQTREGFVVEVGADILFDSGKVALRPAGVATIKRIADVIKRVGTDEALRVDGHTDNDPIKVTSWKDNFHLSAMRAHGVLKALVAEGISSERMFLAGFAFHRAQASNDTREGRQQNRRVEILIVPKMTLSPMTPE